MNVIAVIKKLSLPVLLLFTVSCATTWLGASPEVMAKIRGKSGQRVALHFERTGIVGYELVFEYRDQKFVGKVKPLASPSYEFLAGGTLYGMRFEGNHTADLTGSEGSLAACVMRLENNKDYRAGGQGYCSLSSGEIMDWAW